ncbi:hypothetical protein AVEN_87846-1 [Araneus ventricosus]|uniref:Uncharacterized protein n=1 Tax=Araneus ventricosus TaxID=182803 RepID=A0A4Y2BDF3_ARAVE|nr:hypothetical protein AVEN_87846-1 [Araneus ventricosus]
MPKKTGSEDNQLTVPLGNLVKPSCLTGALSSPFLYKRGQEAKGWVEKIRVVLWTFLLRRTSPSLEWLFLHRSSSIAFLFEFQFAPQRYVNKVSEIFFTRLLSPGIRLHLHPGRRLSLLCICYC